MTKGDLTHDCVQSGLPNARWCLLDCSGTLLSIGSHRSLDLSSVAAGCQRAMQTLLPQDGRSPAMHRVTAEIEISAVSLFRRLFLHGRRRVPSRRFKFAAF